MKQTTVLGTGFVLLLACCGIASANLVFNGGFEDPALGAGYSFNLNTLPCWTVSGDIDLINTYHGWASAGGVQSIDLSGSQRGTISQTIATEAGTDYTLGFAMAGNPECSQTEKKLGVYKDDNPLGSFTFTPTALPGPGQWQAKEIAFKASSDATKITFKDETTEGSQFCGVALDSIVVVESARIPVPEFPTVALPIGLTIALLGAVFYVKNSKEN